MLCRKKCSYVSSDLFNTRTGTIERLYLSRDKVETVGAEPDNVENLTKIISRRK